MATASSPGLSPKRDAITMEQRSDSLDDIFARPSYHFIAPRGWMNDPCAPAYDPETKLFHLFYQWAPESYTWVNISWGHATSTDLIHWQFDQVGRTARAEDQPC